MRNMNIDISLPSNGFTFNEGSHNNKNVIWVLFPYDKDKIDLVKSIRSAKWSQSHKAWYLPDNSISRQICGLPILVIGKVALSRIDSINQIELNKFQNYLYLKSFSINTIRTYIIEFAQLLYLLKKIPVYELSPERFQSYFLYCSKELKLSDNQIHSRINAIKCYFEKVLHNDKMFFDIPRPKKPQKLPKYLNKNEIIKIFHNTDNIKHRVILSLCYGMGLRVSEIVNIKIEDIDSVDMKVFVQNAKGKKDRYVNLPHSILEDLREYYKLYMPSIYLFEGATKGEPYSKRSAQKIFQNAMKKSGIKKSIGIHGLRHSFATHLLEYGTDISLIQKLLGHNDIKTTLIYANVAIKKLNNVKSPLDYLK